MNNVYLFTLPELLTENNLDCIEIKGLAEWSDSVPALFLLLLGDRPQISPWAVYTDGNHPPALVCDWEQAATRLDALLDLSEATDQHHLVARLNAVKNLLHRQRNRHLVLHVSELAYPQHGRNYGGKGFKRFVAELETRTHTLSCQFAAAREAREITSAQPELWRLCAKPECELGYWDAAVADGYWLDGGEPTEPPSFLQEFAGDWHGSKSSGYQFDPKLGAYQVRKYVKKQAALHGIVTAYGRWILPLGEVCPLTNQYEEHTARSWITLSRPLLPQESNGGNDEFAYALLDANGVEAMPFEYASLHTVGDKLVYFRRLTDCRAGQRAFKLLRIDTGTELPGNFDDRLDSSRADGLIEGGFEDGGAYKQRGLLDRDGNLLTDFVYEGFSEFHKKHKVAIVQRAGKCGLIDQQGKVVLPIEYDKIAQKVSDGPPHFHGDATLIFTAKRDAEGQIIDRSNRVGVADKRGRVLATPRLEPWHLQHAFDQSGQMLVHEDDVLYFLNADGTLSNPIGSRQAWLDEIRGQFRKNFNTPQGEPRTAVALAAELDHAACGELIDILCRGKVEASTRLKQAFTALLDSCASNAHEDDELELQVGSDDQPATPFFRALAFAFRDEQIWMHLDWKAADEIPNAHAHLPDLSALRSFKWDGLGLGEDIRDGFTALDAHLAAHGFRLIQYRTAGDYYLVGAVALEQLDRCVTLAASLGIPLYVANSADQQAPRGARRSAA